MDYDVEEVSDDEKEKSLLCAENPPTGEQTDIT